MTVRREPAARGRTHGLDRPQRPLPEPLAQSPPHRVRNASRALGHEDDTLRFPRARLGDVADEGAPEESAFGRADDGHVAVGGSIDDRLDDRSLENGPFDRFDGAERGRRLIEELSRLADGRLLAVGDDGRDVRFARRGRERGRASRRSPRRTRCADRRRRARVSTRPCSATSRLLRACSSDNCTGTVTTVTARISRSRSVAISTAVSSNRSAISGFATGTSRRSAVTRLALTRTSRENKYARPSRR